MSISIAPGASRRRARRRVGTIVVGGGQAGLATSWLLTHAGEDHLVLEAGTVGRVWLEERWSTLRLITPNWMSTLPGYGYAGDDPDGFMTAPQVATYLQGYRASFAAPVLEHTLVRAVRHRLGSFEVETTGGTWVADDVVVATGATGTPDIPRELADALSPAVHQLPLRDFRGAHALPPGAVLVVGASASGLAAAEELVRAGRPVTVAAGRHTWLPRRLAGRDVWWWLRRSGWTGDTIDSVTDRATARTEPRIQLVGGAADTSLAALADAGVDVVGRLVAADGHRVTFADDLPGTLADAEARTAHLLRRLRAAGADLGEVRYPSWVPEPTLRCLDLRGRDITTVLWATGYRPAQPWLHVPVQGDDGHLVQHRGATPCPGLWQVGGRFQHRRDSVFLDGVRHDAADVVAGILARRRGATGRAELTRSA